MASAFVSKGNTIQKDLRSNVTILSGDKSLVVIALWDTGATNSCISMDVVKKLELVSTGKIPMGTPSGRRIADTYLVDIVLPNNVPVDDLMVCDSEIGAQGIGMLIGMDIITKGDFMVNNYNGRTVFSFRMPSDSMTDFVSGIKASNVIQANRNRGKRHAPTKVAKKRR